MAKKTPSAQAPEDTAAIDYSPLSGLVAMVRDPDQFPVPHSADVHPDEVDNYRSGGWTVA